MKRVILSAAVCLLSSLAAGRGAAQAWTQIGPAPIDGNGFSPLPNTTVAGMVQDIAIDPSGSTDSPFISRLPRVVCGSRPMAADAGAINRAQCQC